MEYINLKEKYANIHRQRIELAFILYGDGDIQEIMQ